MFQGVLYDFHPIYQEQYTNQTQLLDTTVEEIKKLRKPPKYSTKALIIQIALFIIIGIPRAIISFTFAVIAGVIFIVLVAFWRAFGNPPQFRRFLMVYWVSFSRILLFLLGIVHINFHGEYDTESRFLVANHVFFFDSWLFLPFFPRPLDRKEIFSLPCLREMCDVFGGIAVDRSKACGLTKELIKNAENPHKPQIILMPEGCNTNGEYMLRFHLGAFLSDLPVQPAAIRYTMWGTNRKISHMSFFQDHIKQWMAFLSIPAITVDVQFLEVMSIKAGSDSDPRKFADSVSMLIGNKLGVKVYNMTSSPLFKNPKMSD